MQGIAADWGGVATFTISGPNTGPDPICCLYSAVNIGGNAWCGGIGGGALPSQWQSQAQSVTCLKGGQIVL